MPRLALFAAIAAFMIAITALLLATDATAYMGGDPKTCNNCHVMDAAYENWYHSGHRHVDVACVDCHLPHDNLVAYYLEKGRSGMHDVFVFATGQTPELLRASEHSQEIIQSNCVRCHETTVEPMLASAQELDRNCWDCHRAAAHGDRGISIAPRQEP